MRTATIAGTKQEYLDWLSENVRGLLNDCCMGETREMICEAMKEYPDAAQPHNLLGILMEMQGNHVAAMRHFQAASITITFLPARKNIENYGSLPGQGAAAQPQWRTGTAEKKKNTLRI